MSTPCPPADSSRIPLAEWANLHTHLLWIYEGEPAVRGDSLAFDLTAWLMQRGAVRVRAQGQSWSARAGEWIFPPAGERSQEFSADARLLSVRFRAQWPTGEDFYRTGLGLVLPAASAPELRRAAQPLLRLVVRNFPRTTNDLMQVPAPLPLHARLQTLYANWFETIVAVFARHGVEPTRMGRIDPRLLQAVRRLDKQPLAAPLPEADLAATAHLSVSQLNRLFQRQFGVSSRGYFERRRHRHAQAMLAGTAATVKEVAFELGFSSLPHFSAWFRRRHGLPPREFQRAAAREPAPRGKNG